MRELLAVLAPAAGAIRRHTERGRERRAGAGATSDARPRLPGGRLRAKRGGPFRRLWGDREPLSRRPSAGAGQSLGADRHRGAASGHGALPSSVRRAARAHGDGEHECHAPQRTLARAARCRVPTSRLRQLATDSPWGPCLLAEARPLLRCPAAVARAPFATAELALGAPARDTRGPRVAFSNAGPLALDSGARCGTPSH